MKTRDESNCKDRQNRVLYPRTLYVCLLVGIAVFAFLVVTPDAASDDVGTYIFKSKNSLLVLCLASMALSVNLLTLSPLENKHKQIAYHVISIVGLIAAFASTGPVWDPEGAILVLMLVPVGIAYGRVMVAMLLSIYPKWIVPLGLGVVLIPAGILAPIFGDLGTLSELYGMVMVAAGLCVAGLFLILEKRYRDPC